MIDLGVRVLSFAVTIAVIITTFLVFSSGDDEHGSHSESSHEEEEGSLHVWWIKALHPAFMSLGFVLFSSIGFVSYTADFGSKVQTRPARRKLHVWMFGLSGGCILLGVITIRLYLSTNFATDTVAHIIHLSAAYATLVLTAAQSITGIQKWLVIESKAPRHVMMWHNYYLGPLVQILGVGVVWQGCSLMLRDYASYDVLLYILMISLAVLVILSLIRFFCGPAQMDFDTFANTIQDPSPAGPARSIALGGGISVSSILGGTIAKEHVSSPSESVDGSVDHPDNVVVM
jgi:hypothetical protein